MNRLSFRQRGRIQVADKVIKLLMINGCNGTKKKEIVEQLEISNNSYIWIMDYLRYDKKLIYCSDKLWYLVEKL